MKESYTNSGFVLRYSKFEKLLTISLESSKNSVEDYVNNIRIKSKDLKRMGSKVDNWILISMLLHNLGTKYKDFRHRIITQIGEIPDFDRIITLLHEEERLLKRDNKELVLAAALKKVSKEVNRGEPNRGGRSNSSSERRGRGNNNNTGSQISKNPASSNYKGEDDKPECNFPKCPRNANDTKKRHWPFDCYAQHPERAPEGWESKPKANIAEANRPDDFVDQDDSHISAMARVVCGDEDMDFEEFWGLEPTIPTPTSDRSVVEERNDQSSQYFPILEESVEMKTLDPLIYPAKFDAELSQDSTQSFDSPTNSLNDTPELSPVGEIIDHLPHRTSLHFLAYTANASQHIVTSDWTIDSGCTNHMHFDKDDFSNYQPYKAGVIIADGNTVQIIGRGTIKMEWLLPDGSTHSMVLRDVLHVPGLTCGLFSISQATRKGLDVIFSGDSCNILHNDKVIGSAPKVNNSYLLSVTQLTAKVTILIQQNMRALATSLMFNEEAVKL